MAVTDSLRVLLWDYFMIFNHFWKHSVVYQLFGKPNLPNLTLDQRIGELVYVDGPLPPHSGLYSTGCMFCVLRWANDVTCVGHANEVINWHKERRTGMRIVFIITHTGTIDGLLKLTKGEYTVMYDEKMVWARDFAAHKDGTHQEFYGYPQYELFGGMPTLSLAFMSPYSFGVYMASLQTFFWPFVRYMQDLTKQGFWEWSMLGWGANLGGIHTAGWTRFMNLTGTLIVNPRGKEILRMQEWAFCIFPTKEDLDKAADELER